MYNTLYLNHQTSTELLTSNSASFSMTDDSYIISMFLLSEHFLIGCQQQYLIITHPMHTEMSLQSLQNIHSQQYHSISADQAFNISLLNFNINHTLQLIFYSFITCHYSRYIFAIQTIQLYLYFNTYIRNTNNAIHWMFFRTTYVLNTSIKQLLQAFYIEHM